MVKRLTYEVFEQEVKDMAPATALRCREETKTPHQRGAYPPIPTRVSALLVPTKIRPRHPAGLCIHQVHSPSNLSHPSLVMKHVVVRKSRTRGSQESICACPTRLSKFHPCFLSNGHGPLSFVPMPMFIGPQYPSLLTP